MWKDSVGGECRPKPRSNTKKLRILPYNGAVALHDDVVRSVLWHCGYEFAVYKNATRLGKASNGIGTNISVLTL